MSVASASQPPRWFEPPTDASLAEVLDVFAGGLCVFDRVCRLGVFNRAGGVPALVERGAVLGRPVWEISPGIVGTALEAALSKVMTDRIAVVLESPSPF